MRQRTFWYKEPITPSTFIYLKKLPEVYTSRKISHFHCHFRKYRQQVNLPDKHEMPKSESSLEIILKESSELAEKVRNCWIDPNNLELNN